MARPTLTMSGKWLEFEAQIVILQQGFLHFIHYTCMRVSSLVIFGNWVSVCKLLITYLLKHTHTHSKRFSLLECLPSRTLSDNPVSEPFVLLLRIKRGGTRVVAHEIELSQGTLHSSVFFLYHCHEDDQQRVSRLFGILLWMFRNVSECVGFWLCSGPESPWTEPSYCTRGIVWTWNRGT